MNKTIHELTPLNIADNDDEFIIYDTSAGDSKKITKGNLCNNSYSTEEQKTGGTWIDGKPIYRKVIDIGALPNNTTKFVAHNISNLGKVIHIYGYSYGGDFLPLPYTSANSIAYSVQIYADSTNIGIRTGADRSSYSSSYVVLEYTKTTE